MKFIKSYENFEEDVKVGDLVMCIDDSNRVNIKNDETYEISEIYFDNRVLCYRLKGNRAGYFAYRFRKITDLELAELKYNL